MVTVDLRLEALAFNYVSFGIFSVVNNLWTWIAVATAAVSFWRIRATTGGDSSSPMMIDHCSAVSEEIGAESENKASPNDDIEPQSTGTPAVETATAIWTPLMCGVGVTKGKLTAYYENDGESDNDDGELTAISNGVKKGKLMLYYDGDRERDSNDGGVLRTMNGEDDWYRYVDLTVINGNVVRLWDDNGVRNCVRFSVQRKLCCGW
ncbi:PREDICTED: uncharacterized protein LOC104811289 [Tarenaya hassleriana]|uniref:uncharacterized protein LOC104811289 n=1 Tax=Tarenaya hassleriana TaxID=28532 RepID=UPI00053C1BA6|nr:PREDICTED: uncharacterized protein LOC104811289 [Tarenaya hassleriana]